MLNNNKKILEKGNIVEHSLFKEWFRSIGYRPNIEYHLDQYNPTWDCKVGSYYFQIKTGVPYALKDASTIQVHQIDNYREFAKGLNPEEEFFILLFPHDDLELRHDLRNKILHHVGRLYVLNKNDLLHNIPWQELKIKNDQHGKRYIIPLTYFRTVYEDLDKIFPEIYNDLSKLGASNYQKKVAS